MGGGSDERECDSDEDDTESDGGVEQSLEARAGREGTSVGCWGAVDELGVRDGGYDEERTGRPGERCGGRDAVCLAVDGTDREREHESEADAHPERYGVDRFAATVAELEGKTHGSGFVVRAQRAKCRTARIVGMADEPKGLSEGVEESSGDPRVVLAMNAVLSLLFGWTVVWGLDRLGVMTASRSSIAAATLVVFFVTYLLVLR